MRCCQIQRNEEITTSLAMQNRSSEDTEEALVQEANEISWILLTYLTQCSAEEREVLASVAALEEAAGASVETTLVSVELMVVPEERGDSEGGNSSSNDRACIRQLTTLVP